MPSEFEIMHSAALRHVAYEPKSLGEMKHPAPVRDATLRVAIVATAEQIKILAGNPHFLVGPGQPTPGEWSFGITLRIAIDRHRVVCACATERVAVRAIPHIFQSAWVLQEHAAAIQQLHAERVRVSVACRTSPLRAGVKNELLRDGIRAGH